MGRSRSAPRRQYPAFTATEAKNRFAAALEQALRGETVVITKHDAPKAVLISFERFNELQNTSKTAMDALTAEFDDMLDRMQSHKSSVGMFRAFHATPKQLGKAAVDAARKRG